MNQTGFRPGSILGTRVMRVEDPEFLTRGAVFTEDLVDARLADALRVTFVRAPLAHARIVSIDASAACAAPGCVGVITSADLDDVPAPAPELAELPAAAAQPLLANERVRYVGEPVAAVLTDTRYTGEDVAELVAVDYEPLPVTVEPAQALAGSTLLFPDLGSNVVSSKESGGADLFAGCEVVVTREIVNQRVAPAPLEVRAAAAAWGSDERLTAWIPNQGAQDTQARLADMLGLRRDELRVITPAVGGAFGAKFGADPEHGVVCWIARSFRRPATWVESRSENMVAMTHGRAQTQTITIGGDRDGRVKAYRLHVLQDSGAYPRLGAVLPTLTMLMAPGVYDIDRVESSYVSVVTNTTPVGAYRGAGRPEATAAIERAMDLFAAEIGMDPVEVRRRNLLPAFTEPLRTKGGAEYDTGNYAAALDAALEAADYAGLRRAQAARRAGGGTVQLGIGVAVYVEITGGGDEAGAPRENASVEVHRDGTATVLTGTSPHGQGHATVWAMLASDELGIPVDRITVRWGDTDLVPEGGGTGGSRSLQQGGAAVRQAARELVEIAKHRAADLLEVAAEDLIVDRAFAGLAVRGVPGSGVTFARLAETEPLVVRSVFTAPGPTYPFGAHVAVVEVDTETGKAVLTRLVAADDAGVVVNPLLAEGQRHGGLAQGAAQALMEEVRFDPDGNPVTTTFADYPIVSATELPSFELVTTETPTTFNPLGAKGIGEAASIGSTPAVQNAIVDAVSHLGVRHIDMPASPMRVWTAVRDATAQASETSCA